MIILLRCYNYNNCNNNNINQNNNNNNEYNCDNECNYNNTYNNINYNLGIAEIMYSSDMINFSLSGLSLGTRGIMSTSNEKLIITNEK